MTERDESDRRWRIGVAPDEGAPLTALDGFELGELLTDVAAALIAELDSPYYEAQVGHIHVRVEDRQ